MEGDDLSSLQYIPRVQTTTTTTNTVRPSPLWQADRRELVASLEGDALALEVPPQVVRVVDGAVVDESDARPEVRVGVSVLVGLATYKKGNRKRSAATTTTRRRAFVGEVVDEGPGGGEGKTPPTASSWRGGGGYGMEKTRRPNVSASFP